MLGRHQAKFGRQLRLGQHRCAVLPAGLMQIISGAGEDVTPIAPQVNLRCVLLADREFTVARGHELQRSHGAGIGTADAQRIEFFLARQQQELGQLLAEIAGARRVVERQGRERVDDAVTAGDAPVARLDTEHGDQVLRRYLVFNGDLVEQLFMFVPQLHAGIDALLRQHPGAVLPPLQRLLGRPADGIDDLLLRLGGAEQRREAIAREALRHQLINVAADFGS